MVKAGGAAVLAAGLVLAGAASGGDVAVPTGVCELGRADRGRTPAVRCMGCHDGSAGPGVEFRMRAGGPGFDHPVDVDYGSAALRDPRLVAGAQLPRELVLVDGRVACTTCHDGASTERAHVVRSKQELCITCHRM